jgi:AraC family transcriptional regulator
VSTGFVYLRPLHVAAVRAKGPYATAAAEAWKNMLAWLHESGAIHSMGAGYGLLLDDPRKIAPENCRYEACIELTEEYRSLVPETFFIRRLPGGAYARKRHVGCVTELAKSISDLRNEWISTQGLVIDTRRPLIEIYLDKPETVASDKQRIDICMPVTIAEDKDRSAA